MAESAEAVALELLHKLMVSERKDDPDRKWLLDTYAECLEAVHRPAKRLAD